MTIRDLLALLRSYAVGAEDDAECEVSIDEGVLVIDMGSDVHRHSLDDALSPAPTQPATAEHTVDTMIESERRQGRWPMDDPKWDDAAPPSPATPTHLPADDHVCAECLNNDAAVISSSHTAPSETEMDQLSEAAAQPLEDRFCHWFLDWLKTDRGTNGDVVHQVGAMLQEMYEIAYCVALDAARSKEGK